MMTKLICPECRHENEGERIYCHNCGARLDRSGLAGKAAPAEDPTTAHRRIKRMFDPNRGRLRRNFFFLCKLVLGACAVACLVQMALPPDSIPPVHKTIGLPAEINFDLEKAVTSRAPMQFQYTEEQVNAYLDYTLRNKKSLNKPLLNFDRAVVGFDEGLCHITVERSVFGYPLYSRTSYEVALANGKIAASNKGGAIGRLPIHPQVMQYIDVIFADLWSALDRERKLIAKMSAMEFHQGSVAIAAAAPAG